MLGCCRCGACSLGVVCRSYLCRGFTLVAWCHRGVLSSWALVSVVFAGCCLSGSYLCVCMVSPWTLVSVVFAGCCLSESYLCRGVTLAVFARCHCGVFSLWGVVVVGTRQRSVRLVSFIGVLPLSENYVRELPLYSLGIAHQCAVRLVLVIQELPLSESYPSQGVTFAWSLWGVCLFTLTGFVCCENLWVSEWVSEPSLHKTRST